MDIRQALKEQYHGGLAMLAECVEKLPDDLWKAGTYPRSNWRIVFHTIFYTHLYLGQGESAFQPWPGRREGIHQRLWTDPAYMEPYELPEDAPCYSRDEMLQYLSWVDGIVDETVDGLDLDAAETGFNWYRNMTKLSHQLMNLRHLQGHVGQLSELVMGRDPDAEIDWVGKSSGLSSRVE